MKRNSLLIFAILVTFLLSCDTHQVIRYEATDSVSIRFTSAQSEVEWPLEFEAYIFVSPAQGNAFDPIEQDLTIRYSSGDSVYRAQEPVEVPPDVSLVIDIIAWIWGADWTGTDTLNLAEGVPQSIDIELNSSNTPPLSPINPSPYDGEDVGQVDSQELSWSCTDPENDSLTFTVHWGADTLMTSEAATTDSNFTLTNLAPYTVYFWRIDVQDVHHATTQGNRWQFSTGANQPPLQPQCLNPLDADTVSTLNALQLSWSCLDPDDDPLTFTVHWGLDSLNLAETATAETTLTIFSLDEDAVYYWRVVAEDDHSNATSSDLWWFSTWVNHAPEKPGNPSPPNGSEVSYLDSVLLSWSCTDQDGDPLTFTFNWGFTDTVPNSDPIGSDTTYILSNLLAGTVYYWRVDAEDAHQEVTIGDVWQFSTGANQPPIEPHDPVPGDGAIVTEFDPLSLIWSCSDPENDPIDYLVEWDTDSIQFANNQQIAQDTILMIAGLSCPENYFWRVTASDDSGGTTEGPIWNFSTRIIAIFPDTHLDSAVHETIARPYDEDIYVSDIDDLTAFTANGRNISQLDGMEYMISLGMLSLSNNQIDSLEPLSGLTELEFLNLTDNQINNIVPLTALDSLNGLQLADNYIDNISSLYYMVYLTYLSLNNNQLSNIDSLYSLTSLTDLLLADNNISDITVLSALNNLTYLTLNNNNITDLSPLSSLTSLTELRIGDNPNLTDISPIANLTNIVTLALYDNQIDTITALAYLEFLEDINLNNNIITDITPLSNDSSLVWVRLENNLITDIFPLWVNSKIDSGDVIWLSGNELNATSVNQYIPDLRARDVTVYYP
jgi:hypothetical protein